MYKNVKRLHHVYTKEANPVSWDNLKMKGGTKNSWVDISQPNLVEWGLLFSLLLEEKESEESSRRDSE